MEERFTLKDRKGRDHEYSVTLHPAVEGMRLSCAVLGLSVPTLLSAVSGALESEEIRASVSKAFAPGDEMKSADRAKGVEELLGQASGVDWSKVGAELGAALGDQRFAPLIRSVLTYTSRTDDEGVPRRLASEVFFEMAYTGNYWEMYRAFWRVCAVNGFFPDLSGIRKLGALARGGGSDMPPMSDSASERAGTA